MYLNKVNGFIVVQKLDSQKKKAKLKYIVHHALDDSHCSSGGSRQKDVSYIRVDHATQGGEWSRFINNTIKPPSGGNATRPQVEKINGFWKLIPMTESKVHVILQLHVEPGGVIPAWIVNLADAFRNKRCWRFNA